MKRYKAAAIIIIIHGLIEIGGFFSVLPIWLGAEQADWMSFEPPPPIVVIGGVIWGVLRLIGGFALYKNRMWGFWFSVILCVKAIYAMFEFLPFGLMDATLGSVALILMLTQYFGKKAGKDRPH
ncbi:MAG: hypothetical protein FWC89_04720 [Defluviitaleaceae bacterium]|nr:hypothetical protein [Defluviitaleaceae bacterium]